jgi:hypothetical protein
MKKVKPIDTVPAGLQKQNRLKNEIRQIGMLLKMKNLKPTANLFKP